MGLAGIIGPGVLGLGGTALSTMAALQQAKALKKTAKFNQKLAKREAAIEIANAKADSEVLLLNSFRADVEANMQEGLGTFQSELLKDEGRRERGAIRAVAAGSGLEEGGSELMILAESEYQNELSIRTNEFMSSILVEEKRFEADQLHEQSIARKRAGRIAAQNIIFQSKLAAAGLKNQASNVRTQAIIGAISGVASTGSQVASGFASRRPRST